MTVAASILQESRTIRNEDEWKIKRKELNKKVSSRNKNLSRKNWSREEVCLGHHGSAKVSFTFSVTGMKYVIFQISFGHWLSKTSNLLQFFGSAFQVFCLCPDVQFHTWRIPLKWDQLKPLSNTDRLVKCRTYILTESVLLKDNAVCHKRSLCVVSIGVNIIRNIFVWIKLRIFYQRCQKEKIVYIFIKLCDFHVTEITCWWSL